MHQTVKLQPGVVTGEDYRTLVRACKDGGYALPAVNVISTHTANAALEAAAKNGSDIIVQMSNSGAAFVASEGFPDGLEAKVLGAVSIAQHVNLVAKHWGICVALHTDHADRKLIPWVEALVGHNEAWFERTGRTLFSSHMLDLSEETLDFNLSECARVLERMARLDMGLEVELGVTGGEEDGVGTEYDDDAESSHLYTQPADVLRAYEVLSPVGSFSVAASFGNVHGVYKPGNVKLRPEILRGSQALVKQKHGTAENPLDLVFHGGSGSEPEKIAEAIRYGVFKMNIDTDTQFAYASAVAEYMQAKPRAFAYQIDPDSGAPYKKVYDPRKWQRVGEKRMVERLSQACVDLGSKGRSLAR